MVVARWATGSLLFTDRLHCKLDCQATIRRHSDFRGREVKRGIDSEGPVSDENAPGTILRGARWIGRLLSIVPPRIAAPRAGASFSNCADPASFRSCAENKEHTTNSLYCAIHYCAGK
jgi:hypothetical protein